MQFSFQFKSNYFQHFQGEIVVKFIDDTFEDITRTTETEMHSYLHKNKDTKFTMGGRAMAKLKRHA